MDGGAGSGTWAVEMTDACRVVAIDQHEQSLAIAAPRLEAAGGHFIQCVLDHVGIADQCAAVVTLLDVLEHLDDDQAALREMIRITRPGGLLVITVPALGWLWSDWDERLQHRRRYYRSDLMRLIDQPGIEVLRCTYINTFALLPIVLIRLWRRLFPTASQTGWAENRLPWEPLNSLLYSSFARPACWRWWSPPLGVSLLAVLRRSPENAL